MMYGKILEIISHIKNISKRNMLCEKTLSNLKKRESSINEDNFKLT